MRKFVIAMAMVYGLYLAAIIGTGFIAYKLVDAILAGQETKGRLIEQCINDGKKEYECRSIIK